jgi:parallel beta-helix repeat protein
MSHIDLQRRKKDMHARATLAALTFAAALVLSATPALAEDGLTTVHCGQTLTQSITLANDLTDCPGDGLVIGADGITVDLNGHTIDGAVTQSDCNFPANPAGGVVNSGFDGVTIANGTVQQFDGGIRATDVNDSRVHDLNVRDNRFGGIDLEASFAPGAVTVVGSRVDHNVVSGVRCGSAINLFNGQGNRFDHNRVRDAQTGISVCCGAATDANVIENNSIANIANLGILVFAAGVAHVERNDLTDIGSGGDACAALTNCIGIEIGGDSSRTVVKDNAITRAQNAGIDVGTCFECGVTQLMTDVRISGNTLTSTGDGIFLVDTDRDVVTRNTVTGAGSSGSPSAFGLGVLLNGVSDTRVSRNTITDGGRGIAPGIVIGLPSEFNPSPRPVNGNVVVRNTVSGQHADGILVALVARDTTLARNTANGNANDGIHVLSPLTTITRNTADDNGAYGIEAVPGVTDGGHNEASGNGNPAQCAGVACS